MAYNDFLEDRINQVFNEKGVLFKAKRMMGGLCYMVDEKMCVGIIGNQLMCRINPDIYEEALKKKGCKEMNFTGRAMKGFIFVDETVIDKQGDLEYWIQLCLDFNPLAKNSKKKK